MELKSQPRVIARAERRLAKRFDKELKQLGKGIAKILEAQETERGLYNDIETYINSRMLQNRGTWLDGDLINLFKLGSRYVNKAVKGAVDLSKINLLAVKRVQGLTSLGSASIDKSINNTTFGRIKEIIGGGLFDGSSYTEIAKNVRGQLDSGVFSRARSEMIAVNTVGNAYEEGRYGAFDDLVRQGYTLRKTWDTVGDSSVTPECRHNQEQGRILYKQNRPSGDSKAPRNSNPRCRCTTNIEIVD